MAGKEIEEMEKSGNWLDSNTLPLDHETFAQLLFINIMRLIALYFFLNLKSFNSNFNSIFCVLTVNNLIKLGNGCGSAGRAVASDTRDLRFESRRQQSFTFQFYPPIVQ